MTDFEIKIQEELAKLEAEVKILKPNIVVAGGTGVGKSSLINRFFGIDIAKVGHVTATTRGIDKYEQENIPVVILDTEGYEASSTNFDEKIKPEFEKMNKGEIKGQIHLVWYCISISQRIQDYDWKNIEYFTNNNMKTTIVLTHCDQDEELADGSSKIKEYKRSIKEKFTNINIFETSTKKELTLDLEKLRLWSYTALDDKALKRGFISAQKISIEAKREEAYNIVKIAASTSALTGAIPIPYADAPLLVAQQVAMCIKISSIFAFGAMGESLSALLKGQLVSMGGKLLASELTKLIPIIGSLINASVAGLLTLGLGSAMIEIYTKAYEDYLETGKLPDWTAIFSSSILFDTVSNFMEENKGNNIEELSNLAQPKLSK